MLTRFEPIPKIERYLTQRDINMNSMINIIGKLEKYEIMQCDSVERIVFKSWMGKIERNGSFMD